MQTYRQFLNLLKREWPKYTVAVRRLKLPDGKLGLCTKLGRTEFLIRIAKHVSEDFAIVILMHEWAHIMSWDGPIWLRPMSQGVNGLDITDRRKARSKSGIENWFFKRTVC